MISPHSLLFLDELRGFTGVKTQLFGIGCRGGRHVSAHASALALEMLVLIAVMMGCLLNNRDDNVWYHFWAVAERS